MFSRPGGASGLVSVAGIWGGFGGSFWVNAWRGGKRLEDLCFSLERVWVAGLHRESSGKRDERNGV